MEVLMTELQTINKYLKKLNATFTVIGGTEGTGYKIQENDQTEHQISIVAYKQLFEEANTDYKTEQITKETAGDAKLKELLNIAKGAQPGDDNDQGDKD